MKPDDIVKRLALVPLTPGDYFERPELPLLVEEARQLTQPEDERPWTLDEILRREA